MRYAEAGYNLEVDLSTGNIERVETDPKLMETHLGGQGVNAKIIWDRVKPDTKPFSEDNLLIFGAGLLHATPVVGCNRTSVNTINPMTGIFGHSCMGGHFGPELKHAGYDRIIIRGRAPKLVYLYIHNERVEIRDASHLAGKGPGETTSLVREELNEPFAQVACIGLAGENKVLTASVEHGYSSASRGPGPIMGDKRLKAIVVRGTKDINIAHPQELFELCLRMKKWINDSNGCGDWMAVDEDDSFHHNNFAWGYSRTRIKNYWSEELQDRWTHWKYDNMDRQAGCYNCPKGCINVISWPGTKRFGYKCYGKDTYHMAAFKELDYTYGMLGQCLDWGVDSYSTPQAISLGIELYDSGVLTDQDIPNFPTDPGERVKFLLEKIVHREGIGDILANGSWWASRMIPGAESFEHNTVKKMEQLPIKLGKLNPAYYLMIATGEKMAITQIEGSFPQDPIRDPVKRKEFVDNWDAAPYQKFKDMFMNWEKRDQISIEDTCALTDWNEAMHYIDDSTGLCGFVSSFRGQFGGQVAYSFNNVPELITLATGMEMDKEGLWEICRRNRDLVRCINNRLGMRRVDDDPPKDHWAVRDPELEEKLLDAYYDFRGWTKDAVPTKAELHRVGLDYVADELIQLGILDPNEGTPAQEAAKAEEQKSGGC